MILYVSDIHIWHTTPRSRLDNYRESCLDMLRKVGKCAAEKKVEAVLLGGDLGEGTDWPISLYNEVLEIFQSYPCPIYTAVGNHDMDSYRLETYRKSGLGALERAGALFVQDTVEIGSDWRVDFFHAGQDNSKKLMAGSWNPDRERDGRVEVAVAHIPVGPQEVKIKKITGVSNLVVPFYDLLCVADIHQAFKPTELITGCLVINPGPLERRKIDERYEGGKVALIDKDLNIEYIDLGAPKAEDVFLQKADSELDEVLGEDFVETMEKIRSAPQVSVEEQIKAMSEFLGLGEQPTEILLAEVAASGS